MIRLPFLGSGSPLKGVDIKFLSYVQERRIYYQATSYDKVLFLIINL